MYIIVGAKTDLTEKRAISFEEAKSFASEIDSCYIEVSSAINTNVDALFEMATYQIYDKIQRCRKL